MAIHITYFVHGTTTDNEQGLASGWNDVDLSEKGVEQAKNLGAYYEDTHFDAVFCSDLKRAVRSATLAFGARAQIIQDMRLRECNYGIYNGKPNEETEPLQEGAVYEPLPGGESYEMVRTRVEEFLTMLKSDYDRKHVGIVAHKAPQLALDVLLKGKTWEQAFAEDWRKTKAWQPGWEYVFA